MSCFSADICSAQCSAPALALPAHTTAQACPQFGTLTVHTLNDPRAVLPAHWALLAIVGAPPWAPVVIDAAAAAAVVCFDAFSLIFFLIKYFNMITLRCWCVSTSWWAWRSPRLP